MPLLRGIVKPHEAFPGVARLDRAVNRWTNRRALGPVADATLSRLSAAADHSVLWAGTALGLAATGHRGRDAALRGYGSLLVSSLLANVVGKTVFGGERPSLEALPLWRRLADPPTSPSFPSGHAASAAAFVTGVALERPVVGLALAPLAGAVTYSRLHTGSHWFSDVVAGAALGATVALVGRALVPGSHDPVDDVPAGPPVDLPALDDGRGLFVVVNPSAGSGRAFKEDALDAVRSGLPHADLHVLAEGDDLRSLFDAAAARGVRALGISGGDGTVATAAAAARAHDLPLAVFPGGTLNHFAKAADLTSMGATVGAVRAGSGVVIDAADLDVDGAEASSRTVLNTFSVGVYPELVTEREKNEHRIGKWPAAVLAAARVLRRAHRVRMTTNGHDGEYWSLFAGVNRYYPQSLAPVERRRLDDGVLDVRTARAERRASRLRTFLEVAAGDTGTRLARRVPGVRRHLVVDASTTPSLELRFPARGAVVGPDGGPAVLPDGGPHHDDGGTSPVVLAHDGEALTIDPDAPSDLVVRLTMRHGALRIYAPRDPKAG